MHQKLRRFPHPHLPAVLATVDLLRSGNNSSGGSGSNSGSNSNIYASSIAGCNSNNAAAAAAASGSSTSSGLTSPGRGIPSASFFAAGTSSAPRTPNTTTNIPTTSNGAPLYSGFIVLPSHAVDLHTHVRSRRRLSEHEARFLFRQLVSAVAHCHKHNIVLRDIKLGKVFFTDETRTHLVIADLDSAQLVSPSEPLLTDQKGSPAYVSPEVLTCQPYDPAAADVWSLGVILYVLLTSTYPFQDKV